MTTLSEDALILAPHGRDATIAAGMLVEIGIDSKICDNIQHLASALVHGAGFAIVTEEAIATADLREVADWIEHQPEWSDFPVILLTQRGGGLERNPAAGRYLETLGNVTFLERPFHPTTFVSIAQAALRARRRQYDARARLVALQNNEQQFRSLANSMPTLCWMAERDGNIFWYNRRWYEYTGTNAEEMRGWGWQSVHDPAILPEVVERWQASIKSGEPFEMVFPLRAADGTYRPFLTRIHPVRDAYGAISRWFGTNTDIMTQREAEEALRQTAVELEKRVEERTAQHEAVTAQLHEAQKLEMIGELTGGVAHDFNNLLTPIRGALELLSRRYSEEDARAARWIENAMQATDRARTLTQRLLGFARRQELEKSAVDIGNLVTGMTDLIRSSIGPQIVIALSVDAPLPPSLVDPAQLELAILNLCVNARDAMEGGGRLTIELDELSVSDGTHQPLPRGQYLRLSVIDTGSGMTAETLKRAVEPFFSTKETGRGTGLGLSMVHGLAAQLGGTFKLISTVGMGTRAELYLPVTSKAVSSTKSVDSHANTVTNDVFTVLLVDDEALVRQGTSDMLRALGHTVCEADGGAAALAMVAGGLSPHILVTDYRMPGMDGSELARRVRAQFPALPVLLVTGYTGATVAGDLPRLSKPFGQSEIAAAIQAVMRGDSLRLPQDGVSIRSNPMSRLN